jgi:hypothetical protein
VPDATTPDEPADQLGFELLIADPPAPEPVEEAPPKSPPAPEPSPEPPPPVQPDPPIEDGPTALAAYDDAVVRIAEEREHGMDPTEETRLFDAAPDPTVLSRSLLDEYKIPPFTTLDTRQGYWQDRKRAWIRLGIQSEIGRDEKLTYGKFNQDYDAETQAAWEALTPEERLEQGHKLANARNLNPNTVKRYGGGSTSVFDPVLTEICYRWLCPPGGTILDPFAGGSVRGIVAACLGHNYVGIELRAIQVDANREQAKDILDGRCPEPLWVPGDSNVVLDDGGFPDIDLIFTCPPYADLEVYSDDPADLSKMSDDEFDRAYKEILVKAAGHLLDNRFAVVVVSNIRNKAGHIRDLVRLTCDGMAAGGCALYNDAILLNVSGTGALRARKQFNTSRKLVRTHQTVLVFAKGDPRVGAEDIGTARYGTNDPVPDTD